MKLKLTNLLLFVTLISSGQAVRVETIRHANPITKEVYIFPKVTVSNSSIASQKINRKLRTSVFGIPAEGTDESLFDSSWRTAYRMENVSDLSFKVSEVNDFVVSLSISGQGCGAYCEAFTYYFTFNAKTGNVLTLDSLFTAKGLIAFFKEMNYNKSQKLKKKLNEINKALVLSKVKEDALEKERFLEMLSMYTDCLEKKIDIAYIPSVKFLLKEGMMTAYTDRCSAHYNMVYDQLWTFVYKAALKNYHEFLTPYGASLISR